MATVSSVITSIKSFLTSKYLALTGGKMSGGIEREGTSIMWKDILDNSYKNKCGIYQSTYNGYMPMLNMMTTDGRVGLGTYQNCFRMTYFLNTNDTNTPDNYFQLDSSGATVNGRTIPTLVSTGKSTSSWYRVFSDGWIEQGGIFAGGSANSTKTVTFPKAFTTANTIQTTIVTTRGGASYDGEIFVRSKTLTNFVAGSRLNDASYYMWYACGY